MDETKIEKLLVKRKWVRLGNDVLTDYGTYNKILASYIRHMIKQFKIIKAVNKLTHTEILVSRY